MFSPNKATTSLAAKFRPEQHPDRMKLIQSEFNIPLYGGCVSSTEVVTVSKLTHSGVGCQKRVMLSEVATLVECDTTGDKGTLAADWVTYNLSSQHL